MAGRKYHQAMSFVVIYCSMVRDISLGRAIQKSGTGSTYRKGVGIELLSAATTQRQKANIRAGEGL